MMTCDDVFMEAIFVTLMLHLVSCWVRNCFQHMTTPLDLLQWNCSPQPCGLLETFAEGCSKPSHKFAAILI